MNAFLLPPFLLPLLPSSSSSFLFLTCRKVSLLLLKLLRLWNKSLPWAQLWSPQLVGRKQVRARKIQGGSRHIQLTKEVVRKGRHSKMPPEIIPGTSQGDVCQSLTKLSIGVWTWTTEGFISEYKQPALNRKSDKWAVSLPQPLFSMCPTTHIFKQIIKYLLHLMTLLKEHNEPAWAYHF